MSLGCDTVKNIVDEDLQAQDGVIAELFEYCDKNLVTIKRMKYLYKQEFQETKKSNSKVCIKLNTKIVFSIKSVNCTNYQ